MWIKAAGQIGENTYQVTNPVSTHLLIADEGVGLVDASVTAMGEQFVRQISELVGDPENLVYLFITHSDFDHIGCVPQLRRFNPDLQIVGLPQLKERFADAALMGKRFEENKKVASAMNVELDVSLDEWLESLRVDRLVGDGESVLLGEEVEVKVFSTPGHSVDSASYFVLPDGVIAAGEALGSYAGRDRISSSYSHSYVDFLASLDRISTLDVKVVCLPHGGSVSGDLAKRFIADIRTGAEKFYNQIVVRLAQGEVRAEIVDAVLAEWLAETISPEGPFVDLRREGLSAMIDVIAKQSAEAPKKADSEEAS